MARKHKPSFMELLASPLTLVPIMLGIGSATIFWATSQNPRSHKLALFLAAIGCLGGLGTMLTMWMLQPGVKPTLLKRRQELLGSLETLLNQEGPGSTQESPQLATEAPVEHV